MKKRNKKGKKKFNAVIKRDKISTVPKRLKKRSNGKKVDAES